MRRLLAFHVVLTFDLIVLGGTVRNFGAGLSCPDWPLCFGQWFPPMDLPIFLEWFHRLIASIIGFSAIAVCVGVWRDPARRARSGKLAAASLLLVIVQAFFGGLTVTMRLNPATVMTHLALGWSFFATTVWLWHQERGEVAVLLPHQVQLRWQLPVLTLAVFFQAVLGVLVSSHGAGLACLDFPLCNGHIIPELKGIVAYQFAHRSFAYFVVVALGALVWWVRRQAPIDRGLYSAVNQAFALLVAQIAVGAGLVWLRVPIPMSVVHLAIGTGIFSLLLISSYKVWHARIS